MDSFYFNKIAGATLSSLLVLVGIRTFVEILYPTGRVDPSKPVIQVTSAPVQTEQKQAQAAPSAEQEKPIEVLLASANPEAGQAAAKACAACHLWEKGAGAKVGPNLYGVVGREIGKAPGFSYSSALTAHGGNWTPDALNQWLKNPKAYIAGNKMAFAGVAKEQDRANIIAFLNKQSDNPKQLSQK